LRRAPKGRFGVVELAEAAGMSLRTLHRRCQDELGATPAKLIERLRTEHARLLISTTALEAKRVAARSGFENPARMARAFQRTLGMTPRAYRALFASGGRTANQAARVPAKRRKLAAKA